MLPGFVPPACSRRVACEQGRSARFRRKPVGPDKPVRRGRSDDLAEVRLADSTQRSGEPATWGSGQRKLNCSWATPTKTKLVEFGRFAQQHASKHGRKRPETIYFLGFTLYCTRNLKGNFKVGMRTEKSRLRRSLLSLQDLMRRMRHLPVREQVDNLNAVLRGHYAYCGIGGNIRALQKVYRAVERYWHKMLCSRSWAGRITWDVFHQIKVRLPLLRPKLYLPYRELQAFAVL